MGMKGALKRHNFEKYNLFEECVAKCFPEELVISGNTEQRRNMEIDIFVEKKE